MLVSLSLLRLFLCLCTSYKAFLLPAVSGKFVMDCLLTTGSLPLQLDLGF